LIFKKLNLKIKIDLDNNSLKKEYKVILSIDILQNLLRRIEDEKIVVKLFLSRGIINISFTEGDYFFSIKE